ncbi:MAG: MASE4 domain-containing protein [Rhodopila sp.]
MRLALLLLLALSLAFAAAIPLAARPAGRSTAFLPAYEASLFICDLITFALLTAQFKRSRSLAVLILGAIYLFDALMIVAHALSFPGLFAETGLLGAGEQTTIWIYIAWHAGFPLYVLGYAMMRRWEDASQLPPWRPWPVIAGVGVLVVLIASAIGVLTFPGHSLLPRVIDRNDYIRLLTTGISPVVWLLCIIVFVILWRVRRRSVLGLWLCVVMGAWIMDVGLAIVIGSSRFDWGFYLSRSYGLLAATIVLVALLFEMAQLYEQLDHSLKLAEAWNGKLLRSRDELARAQRLEAVGQLIGGVAQDFNNLLMVVTGNLELMCSAAAEPVPTRVRRHAEIALRAAQRGAKTIDQLMTFARRQHSRPVTADLNALLAELQPLLDRALPAGIELHVQPAPEPVVALLDPAQFEAPS